MQGPTSLHDCARNNDLAGLQALLQNQQLPLNALVADALGEGVAALHIAARLGLTDIAQALLQALSAAGLERIVDAVGLSSASGTTAYISQ
jgi:ankyrin repeat protein